MFDIYKLEFDCGFIDKAELKSYVPNYDLTKAQYEQIAGEPYEIAGDTNVSNSSDTQTTQA